MKCFIKEFSENISKAAFWSDSNSLLFICSHNCFCLSFLFSPFVQMWNISLKVFFTQNKWIWKMISHRYSILTSTLYKYSFNTIASISIYITWIKCFHWIGNSHRIEMKTKHNWSIAVLNRNGKLQLKCLWNIGKFEEFYIRFHFKLTQRLRVSIWMHHQNTRPSIFRNKCILNLVSVSLHDFLRRSRHKFGRLFFP